MKTLIVAPHADDAEFFAGGLMAKLKGREVAVHVLILGVSGFRRADGRNCSREERLLEIDAASKLLGYTYEIRHQMAENDYLEAGYGHFVAAIEMALDQIGPKRVIIPLPSYNQDHRRVYEAAMTALRPIRGFQGTVWAAEYPMQGWGPGQQHTGEFTGRVYVPLTLGEMGMKKDALSCHASQIEGRDTTLTGTHGAHLLGRMRGLECGHQFAEMFVPLREVREC